MNSAELDVFGPCVLANQGPGDKRGWEAFSDDGCSQGKVTSVSSPEVSFSSLCGSDIKTMLTAHQTNMRNALRGCIRGRSGGVGVRPDRLCEETDYVWLQGGTHWIG